MEVTRTRCLCKNFYKSSSFSNRAVDLLIKLLYCLFFMRPKQHKNLMRYQPCVGILVPVTSSFFTDYTKLSEWSFEAPKADSLRRKKELMSVCLRVKVATGRASRLPMWSKMSSRPPMSPSQSRRLYV